MTIRVLIVDDSAIVRKTLENELSKDADIEVVGTASDPYVARDKIVELRPDVVTLDIEMPRMDGITFLRKLMASFPLPVIIVSSLSKSGSEIALEAMQAGAVEVMCKPGVAYSVGDMSMELRQKIRAAARANMTLVTAAPQAVDPNVQISAIRAKRAPMSSVRGDKVILIGASTGGTQALEYILTRYPHSAPGTVIVQHMPAGFTRAFADRLDKICAVEVKEAEDGDVVAAGRVLIAPGNRHLLIRSGGGQVSVHIKDGPLVGHHRPAVEIMFQSAAEVLGNQAVAVMLTGMGADGAQGMLKMKRAGAVTVAQDEKSSVVYGMPKAAFEIGAVDHVLPLEKISPFIVKLARGAAFVTDG